MHKTKHRTNKLHLRTSHCGFEWKKIVSFFNISRKCHVHDQIIIIRPLCKVHFFPGWSFSLLNYYFLFKLIAASDDDEEIFWKLTNSQCRCWDMRIPKCFELQWKTDWQSPDQFSKILMQKRCTFAESWFHSGRLLGIELLSKYQLFKWKCQSLNKALFLKWKYLL